MLSVIIITKNEAENIERCLKSVAWADEIIIVDSGSTDRTIEIASEYTENIFSGDWKGYGIQKQRALMQATGDWVLNLDADESVTPELQKEIQAAVLSTTISAYRIPLRLHFYDKTLKHSLSPSRRIRLFKRAGAHYSDDVVHERILLPDGAKVAQLCEYILHYSYRDISHALSKMNQYSSSSAKLRLSEKAPPMFLGVLFSAGWMFVRTFIFQLGFLDGKSGLILSIMSMEAAYYRGLKQLYPDQEKID